VIRLKGDNCYYKGEFDPEFQIPDYIVHPTRSCWAVWDSNTLANAFTSLNIDNKDSSEVDGDGDDEYKDIE
jgi:hypothetical protein